MPNETLDPQKDRPASDPASADELESLHNLPSAQRNDPVSADDLSQHFAMPSAQEPVYEKPGNQPQDTADKNGGALSGKGEKNGANDRDELANKEKSGGESSHDESLYKKAEDLFDKSNFWNLRKRISRRQAIFGGGLLGTIISLIIFLTIGSGPFQFVQIAKLMQQFHFSHQENAGDGRMGRLYRYARNGNNPGETRVGWLGSKIHARMMADLEKIGLKPIYKGVGGVYDGIEIDRSSPGSPFKNMSNDELKKALQARGVNPNEIKFGAVEGKGGLPKATVSVKGYFNQLRSLNLLSELAGTSKTPGAVRTRVLARYGLVTWHPLKRLDARLNVSLANLYDKWKAAREERLAKGRATTSIDASKAKQTASDGKGGVITTDLPPEGSGTVPPDKIKGLLKSVSDSKSFKITGALATAVGIVCAARTVNDNLAEVKYLQVIAPLIRMGMDAVVVGNQIMSGQDVDTTTASFLAKSFNEVNAEGKIVSNWFDAQSIQNELGKSGGVNVDATPAGVRDIIAQGSPPWLSWTNDGKVSALCGKVGSIITGVISVTVSVISGGTVSAAGSFIGSALAGQFVIDKLTNLLSGKAVNVLAAGAEWGNNINYGSRLGANAMSLTFGGVALTDSQSSALAAAENARVQQEFNSQSLAHKLFSPTDPYSAMAKLVNHSSPSFIGNLNNIGTIFTRANSFLAAIPKLLTPKVSAAVTAPYSYGFPEYGFSQEDLNNPTVADPYENAQKTAAILNDATGQQYIDKALDCFGVNIVKGAEGWDAIPGDGNKGPFNAPTNPYGDQYNSGDCLKPSGLDATKWLRIRFFIFDSGIMQGYACYKSNDPTSCANSGFDSGVSGAAGPSQAPAPGSTGPPPTGSAQDLAAQLMQYLNNGKISCNLKPGCLDIINSSRGLA